MAAASYKNKMSAGNLAIVLSPNLLPCQESGKEGKGGKERKHGVQEVDSVKLKQHTAILEVLLGAWQRVGLLPGSLEDKYKECLAIPSYQVWLHLLASKGSSELRLSEFTQISEFLTKMLR